MHKTDKFSAVKIENFIGKKFILLIILLKKTLFHVGTHWNRFTEVVLMSTHNVCFRANISKIVYPCIPQFYYIKVGFKHDCGNITKIHLSKNK